MAKIAKKLTDLIGNTPLLELDKFSAEKGLKTPIIAKVEYFNPGGSVKDRIALAMIEDAEQQALRQEYLADIKASLRSQLERTSIQEPDGTIHKVTRRTDLTGERS